MTANAATTGGQAQDARDPLARVLALVDPVLIRKGRPPARAEQDLRQAGLSSLDTVNLMLALEGEFDLFIPQADMTPENFRSAAAIVELIARLD